MATRTPLWKTIPHPSVDGSEPRYAQWSFPRWRYEIPFEVLRSGLTGTEFAALAGFYNSVSGSALPWAYPDPDDGVATAQSFGTGDGITSTFQLVRSKGGFAEPTYLITTSPTIYVNGTPTSITNGTGGTVTFGSAPAAGAALTWSGTFSWLCRFDDDQIDFEGIMRGFWALPSLKFTTEKL